MGSLGTVPPLRRYLQGAPTSRRQSRLARCLALSGSAQTGVAFDLPWSTACLAPHGPGPCSSPVGPAGYVVSGDDGISQVPGRTLASAPRPPSPEGPPCLASCGTSVLPLRIRSLRLPRSDDFRASFPWLTRSLSTLRGSDCSVPTQDSLRGWWPAFAGWGSHPPGSLRKVSRWLLHRSPFPRLCLAQRILRRIAGPGSSG
jgi:hypothetical protein